jgi:arylformamidase
MRQIFRSAIFAALIATPAWADFTPPPSPDYCPWPAWKLPDAQPGEPIVYTDPNGVEYTKPQIDSAYDQTCWRQDPPDTSARSAWLAADFLENFGPPERYAYGPSPYEELDLYRTPAGRHAPTLIYIHGGAWRAGSAAGSASMAENFVEAGANLIALDFINVIQAGGNLITMAEQVRTAVAWVYQNSKMLRINPDRIYVSGFSSGGHLCGVVITTDWAARGLPRKFIQGAVCGSGMYDLYPVSLSARNLYVDFQLDDTIEKLSPIKHIDNIHFPVVLAHGTKETPEFQRQTEEFAAALEAAGKEVVLIVAPGYNHFEFNETFANPYGPLGRASLELMGLQPGAALLPGQRPKHRFIDRHRFKQHFHK